MENILLVWAVRHPACGYVQGMNDLLVPLLYVNLIEYTYDHELTDERINQIPELLLEYCEADSYWELDAILSRIQNNYTMEQKGVMDKISRMENIIQMHSPEFALHLQNQNVMFLQFSFRWINCCLLREFSLQTALRLWDAYISVDDGTGFGELNMYCCVALLLNFKENIMKMDFTQIIQFLQHLPTMKWNESDVEKIITVAYELQQKYCSSK